MHGSIFIVKEENMLLSLALILLLGLLGGYLATKIRIPSLVMMIVVGLIIGPYTLNLIAPSVLNISSELRQIALVIILTRSGLSLDLAALKKVGRPALLMSFIPASLEILAVTVLAHYLLDLTLLEGLLLGSVLAAVSPAVVSPRMIDLIKQGYGKEREVPKLVLAGASVDDIFVIVLFYAFLGLVETNTLEVSQLLFVPLSIVLGIICGVIVGLVFSLLVKKFKLNLAVNVVIFLSLSFLLVGLEQVLKPIISVSSLLGVLVASIVILFTNKQVASQLSSGYQGLWRVFEIILFVLVGASLDFTYALAVAPLGLLVLFGGLLFRSLGVVCSLFHTKFSSKERLFIIISYLPKATVQASIGGIALSLGLPSGQVILSLAVLAIVVTAPIGAFLIDISAKSLLRQSSDDKENLVAEFSED